MLQLLLEQAAHNVDVTRPDHKHFYSCIACVLGLDKDDTSGAEAKPCDRICRDIRAYALICVPTHAMRFRMDIPIQQRMECFAHVHVLTNLICLAVLVQRVKQHRFKALPCWPLLTVRVQESTCFGLALPAEIDLAIAVGSAQLG